MRFYQMLESYGRNIAIYEEGMDAVTYEELAQLSDSIVASIDNTKALVLILCTNKRECIAGYLGCLRHGHVPLLLDAAINESLIKNLLDTYKPNYVWAPSAQYNTGKVEVTIGRYSLRELHSEQYDIFPDLALLMTTSGSTGSPKLVRLSYGNIQSNAGSIADYLELTETERPITTLPMNYVYGLSIINSHLLKGAAIILNSYTLMQRGFWGLFKEYGATSFSGVPYSYEMLRKLDFFSMEHPTLKTMTQAGGKLSFEIAKEFATYANEKRIRFYVMYGQAEATSRMSYLPYQYALSKCGSVGRAIPGGLFRLIDDNGNVVNESEQPGELVYEGPNVSLGYAETLAELAQGDINGGVLYTGDIAKRDSDGFYYIIGRKKRFIKVFGNRVGLDEVEEVIKNRGFECACMGVDDRLMVALTNKKAVAEVSAFLPSLLSVHKSAIHVAYIPEIPKNEAGKTIYTKLQEVFNEC